MVQRYCILKARTYDDRTKLYLQSLSNLLSEIYMAKWAHTDIISTPITFIYKVPLDLPAMVAGKIYTGTGIHSQQANIWAKLVAHVEFASPVMLIMCFLHSKQLVRVSSWRQCYFSMGTFIEGTLAWMHIQGFKLTRATQQILKELLWRRSIDA